MAIGILGATMRFIRGGADLPDALIQAHEDGEVVFFCGAGISYPAGLPGFKDLVSTVFAQIGQTMSAAESQAFDNDQYDGVVQLLERRIDPSLVRQAIAAILTPQQTRGKAIATHRALLSLAKDREDRTKLVTTNFDRLFIAADPKRASFVAPLLPVPKRSRWNGIVYLHGLLTGANDLADLNQLIVSSGDFGLAYLTERWGSRFVSELFRNYVVCFVGYQVADPVLRYMVDALWADRRVGEPDRPVYAFAGHEPGQESLAEEEWNRKGITPILYSRQDNHAMLHRTLRKWAQVYSDGMMGKQLIVARDARARPSRVEGDGQVSRVLWALYDPTGAGAKSFSEMKPAPPIEWLRVLCERRFTSPDLPRFGVPGVALDAKIDPFSMVTRIAPVRQAGRLSLCYRGLPTALPQLDAPLFHLAHWLAGNHLDKPELIEWVLKEGPILHPRFAELVRHYLRKGGASTAVQTLWSILLSDRTHGHAREGVPEWLDELKHYGWTSAQRIEFARLLRPLVKLGPARERIWRRRPQARANAPAEAAEIKLRDLTHADIVLTGGPHVALWIREHARKLNPWPTMLADMLPTFTSLLVEMYELLVALQQATPDSDLSYISRPSIIDSKENNSTSEWDILVDLCRDAFLITVNEAPRRARLEAERWQAQPFPLFRRLLFFAAAHSALYTCADALDMLQDDHGWWLFSPETQNEAVDLVRRIAKDGSVLEQRALLKLILKGPLKSKFVVDITAKQWRRILDTSRWLRLTAFRNAGGVLTARATRMRDSIVRRRPEWSEVVRETDAMPVWIGSGGPSSWRQNVELPRELATLVKALKERPADDFFYADDWRAICEDDSALAADALATLGASGLWPDGVWSEALQVWAQPALIERGWSVVAPLLDAIPGDALQEFVQALAYLLRNAGEIAEIGDPKYFTAIQRVLDLCATQPFEPSDDPVGQAINHPVGYVIEGAFRYWYRTKPATGAGISDPPKAIFVRVISATPANNQCGRVILASNLMSLFLADPVWTAKSLVPLFQWEESAGIARAVWEGYLWGPRMSRELLLNVKSALLSTANHFESLGDHGGQYVGLLVWSALEFPEILNIPELRAALAALPADALVNGARVLDAALAGALEGTDDLWTHRVRPLIVGSWPKTLESRTAGQSTQLSALCTRLKTKLPDAVDTVLPLLGKASNLYATMDALASGNAPTHFPEAVIRLLDRVVDTAAQFAPEKLKEVLDRVQAADAAVAERAPFRRLREFADNNSL